MRIDESRHPRISLRILTCVTIFAYLFLFSRTTQGGTQNEETTIFSADSEETIPFTRSQLSNIGSFFGLKATRIAEGWGAYCGAGYGTWGVTDKESHSGKQSTFLTFDKKQNAQVSLGLLIGAGNGYSGEMAIPIHSNASYHFSFYLKGDISVLQVSVICFTATSENSKATRKIINPKWLRQNGSEIKFSRSANDRFHIFPTKQWALYSGEFTTPTNTRTINILVNYNNPVLLTNGDSIFIDDVKVSKNY